VGSKNNSSRKKEIDNRHGTILVKALSNRENWFYTGQPANRKLFFKTYIGTFTKSPVLEKLFKKARENKGRLPNVENYFQTSLQTSTQINQKEFDKIFEVLGGLFNFRRMSIPGWWTKVVNYKGHAYDILFVQGTLEIPFISVQDREIRKKVVLEEFYRSFRKTKKWVK